MANELRYDRKTVLVTGAGRGLGREYALLFARRGANVVVNDLGGAEDGRALAERPADAVVAEIVAAGGKAVADRNSVLDGAAIVDTAIQTFGGLDVVINNAGITGGGWFGDVPAETWDRLVQVHLGGTVAVTRAAWPHLVKSGAGRVVNMSSTASFGAAFASQYSTAKAAIIGFTRSLGDEGRSAGITVNAVMPSAYTRLTAQITNAALTDYLKKYFHAASVASFVGWLAHESTTISGELFSVAGHRAGRVVLAEGVGCQVDQATPEAWAALQDQVMSLDEMATPLSMMDELWWQMGLLNEEGAQLAAKLRAELGEAAKAI